MTKQKEDARRSARYATTTEVWWSAAGDEWEICETGDLSEVGCFILSTKQPAPKVPLHVSIRVKDGNWLRLKAHNVYELEVGFGVEFIYETDAERRALADFIAAQRATPDDFPA